MSVKNLIDAIASGSAIETQTSFNQVMAEKISARLDDMRVQVAQNMFKEEVESEVELTEEQLVEEALDEVLNKDASAGEWIKDFVKSDNPKFEGKSKDKRKEMALAAYYAKQKNESIEIDEMLDYLNENEEVLAELSKTTLGSYVKKAGQHRVRLAGAEKELDDKDSAIQKAKHGMDNDSYSAMSNAQDAVRKQRNKVSDKSTSRAQGISTAIKKLTKEDAQELDEISKEKGTAAYLERLRRANQKPGKDGEKDLHKAIDNIQRLDKAHGRNASRAAEKKAKDNDLI